MAKKKRADSPTRYEKLDPTPAAIPLKFKRVESQADKMRRIIREEMSRAAEDSGMESFEEADDFAIEDDYDPRSPYEQTLEQELAGYEPAGDQRSLEGETETPGPGNQETAEPVQPSGDTPAASGKGKAGDPPAAG